MKEYSDAEKKEFIAKYSADDALKGESAETIERYREFVREGLVRKWKEALYAMAYGCYGGNEAFDCDWEMSRDCLLKLIEMDEDPFLCNTLGYIYYYGRCNGGVPEYDKALKYFTVGAFSGIFESQYKLADMLTEGLGVPKNRDAAANILLKLYDENIELFEDGVFDGKFADVALRVGKIYEEGLGVDRADVILAYAVYLQAKYAIEKRRAIINFAGDAKVESRILEAIERVKPLLPKGFFSEELALPYPSALGDMMEISAGIDVCIKFDHGKYYLTATRFAAENEPKQFLVTIAPLDLCKLTNTLKMELRGVTDISIDTDEYHAFIHEIYHSERGVWEFIYHKRPLFTVECDEFVFTKDCCIQ